MKAGALRWFSLADVTLLPAFILWFIWQLQFTARWTWIIFVIWLAVSFLLHRDTPKTLGWRADNLLPATKQAVMVIGAMVVGLIAIGSALRFAHASAFTVFPARAAKPHFLAPVVGLFRILRTAASSAQFARAQPHDVSAENEWTSATLTGVIFAACHWPNPVLVPLTFVGGAAMAWLFGRHRNIIPLAIGQAILGSIIFWAFPIAWHHHLRVGPGFYGV